MPSPIVAARSCAADLTGVMPDVPPSEPGVFGVTDPLRYRLAGQLVHVAVVHRVTTGRSRIESRSDGRRRHRPAGDRAARARARAPSRAGRAAVHRGRARLRGHARASGHAPGGALLRQGGGGQGARAARLGPARRRDRGQWRAAVGAAERARGGTGAGARRDGRDLAHPHARDGRRRRGGRPMSFPRWLEPLIDAELMRETDRWAIESKRIPGETLMERAGEGLARVVAARAPAGRIAIVCGKGNNGGDGLVAARILRQGGRDVDVLAVWPPEWMLEDAAEQAKKLPGAAPVGFEAGRLDRAHVIVDAVLGTGFTGEPRDPVAAVIDAMNAAKAPVVAADVPSGVDAST